MPDNTWYTPYVLPNKDCLSIAASQGLVYKLSKHHVLKMPYQYPLQSLESIDIDEAVEQLELSQGSIDSFNRERAFYRLLDSTDYHDIVRFDHSTFEYGILLEYLQPLETAWMGSSVELRLRWIRQLLRAIAKIEELGYIHDDLAVRNMGVDKNDDLKLFDFGSIQQRDDEFAYRSIEGDLSRLANCLHFLLSGNDPFADVPDRESLRQLRGALQNGTFVVDALARPVEGILKSCWAKNLAAMGEVDSSLIFRHVGNAIRQALDIKDDFDSTHEVVRDQLTKSSTEEPDIRGLHQTRNALDTNQYDLTRDSRWMGEEEYVEAWRTMGVTM